MRQKIFVHAHKNNTGVIGVYGQIGNQEVLQKINLGISMA